LLASRCAWCVWTFGRGGSFCKHRKHTLVSVLTNPCAKEYGRVRGGDKCLPSSTERRSASHCLRLPLTGGGRDQPKGDVGLFHGWVQGDAGLRREICWWGCFGVVTGQQQLHRRTLCSVLNTTLEVPVFWGTRARGWVRRGKYCHR
jgi:hypothetical protein